MWKIEHRSMTSRRRLNVLFCGVKDRSVKGGSVPRKLEKKIGHHSSVCGLYWSVHQDCFITYAIAGQRSLDLPPVDWTRELGWDVAIRQTSSSITRGEYGANYCLLSDLRSDFILQCNHFQMFYRKNLKIILLQNERQNFATNDVFMHLINPKIKNACDSD